MGFDNEERRKKLFMFGCNNKYYKAWSEHFQILTQPCVCNDVEQTVLLIQVRATKINGKQTWKLFSSRQEFYTKLMI